MDMAVLKKLFVKLLYAKFVLRFVKIACMLCDIVTLLQWRFLNRDCLEDA